LLNPRGVFAIREGTDVRRRNLRPPRQRDRLIDIADRAKSKRLN
jgi:hypothetical protein